jgi:hypothetical protein
VGAPDAGAASRSHAAALFVSQLLHRHALDHLVKRGVGHVSADAPHWWGERIHDLVQLPGVTGRSFELELHAHPLIAVWS